MGERGYRSGGLVGSVAGHDPGARIAVGKRTLTETLFEPRSHSSASPQQPEDMRPSSPFGRTRADDPAMPAGVVAGALQPEGGTQLEDAEAREVASAGIAETGASLPHLDAIQRSFGEHDISGVRAHMGDAATAAAHSMGAEAYAMGNDVAFAAAPDLRTAAHEVAHVVQQRSGVSLSGGVGRAGDPYEQQADAVAERVVRGESAADLLTPQGGGDVRVDGMPAIQRKTKGEQALEEAHTDWLDPHASVKDDTDVIKAALKEIKVGKRVGYNQGAGKKKLASALATLGKSKELASVEAEWDWLVENRASAAKEGYKTKERALFQHLEAPLAALGSKHPKAHTHYWLRNSPAQVLDVIISAADAEMPAEQLWAYANVEGLVDYVRDQIGLDKTTDPTAAQLNTVSTSGQVSGFGALGMDDFFTDLTAKNEPLSGHLPKGFDVSKVRKDAQTNEKGREVESAVFPDLKMALQALAASLKRRRAIFRADAKKHGYAAPTTDELVYWTYVYSNVGEFNKQLEKYKGKRKLADWITASEYPNAIKLLESYRMIKAMKIF